LQARNVTSAEAGKSGIEILWKPESHVEDVSANPILIYGIAILLGILVPLGINIIKSSDYEISLDKLYYQKKVAELISLFRPKQIE